MTIQERKLLKLIRSITHKTEKLFYYDSTDSCIHLDENYECKIAVKKLSSEINGLLKSLCDKVFIELVPEPDYSLDGDKYFLTHKGLHPLQFSIEKFKKFLFTSILTPIVVSFITTLLTLLVTTLLSET